MSLELYADFPIRTWGTHEMNSGLSKMYRYQSRVYYHEKKGWNLHLARLFCLLASPLTNLFYKGFALLGQISLKHGIDPLIYTSYFKIKEKVYIFDKPILFSELKKIAPTKELMAKYLVDKCNKLGQKNLNELNE